MPPPVTFKSYFRFTITAMIKRSTILLLVLMIISSGLLLFTSYSSAATRASEKPAKCSIPRYNSPQSPQPWIIISPAMFQNQG